jgi:8-oxo-dGTP pyrophosphatase MutT (NUDIX family)
MAVVPRAAATVVLLRDGRDGLEAYLQLRPMGMGFAGGLWVFPGGRVDEADRDPAVDVRWAGPPAAVWGERLGLPVDDARGYVVAACRETLEESGLLLATPAPGAEELARGRRELLEGSSRFAELLDRLGVRLDAGRLRYWAWWVTPVEEPRRYDTRFFVAGLPADAAVTAHVAEAERERWLPPGEAAADLDLPMLPPTRYTLRDLAAFGSVEAALAAASDRRVEPILPVLRGADLIMPWRERYPVPTPLLEPGGPGGPGGQTGRDDRPPVGP